MKELFLYYLPCLWAFFCCLGFGLVFNIRGVGNLVCGLGGAVGWFVYLSVLACGQGDIFAAFLSAMVIAAYSEWMARVRRCPVTGYLQVALLPLVPGAGIYHTMQWAVQGDNEMFISTLMHTFGFAAALSVGAMLTSSVLRALLPRVHFGGR